MDVLSKKARSRLMSRIRGKWTSPERKVHNFLKGKRIKHEMHPVIAGKPDVFLPNQNIVVFIQGCFWHKCPKHFVEPKTKREFWMKKIKGNIARDRTAAKKLRKVGYKVVRIWEHEVRDGSYKRKLSRLIR